MLFTFYTGNGKEEKFDYNTRTRYKGEKKIPITKVSIIGEQNRADFVNAIRNCRSYIAFKGLDQASEKYVNSSFAKKIFGKTPEEMTETIISKLRTSDLFDVRLDRENPNNWMAIFKKGFDIYNKKGEKTSICVYLKMIISPDDDIRIISLHSDKALFGDKNPEKFANLKDRETDKKAIEIDEEVTILDSKKETPQSFDHTYVIPWGYRETRRSHNIETERKENKIKLYLGDNPPLSKFLSSKMGVKEDERVARVVYRKIKIEVPSKKDEASKKGATLKIYDECSSEKVFYCKRNLLDEMKYIETYRPLSKKEKDILLFGNKEGERSIEMEVPCIEILKNDFYISYIQAKTPDYVGQNPKSFTVGKARVSELSEEKGEEIKNAERYTLAEVEKEIIDWITKNTEKEQKEEHHR